MHRHPERLEQRAVRVRTPSGSGCSSSAGHAMNSRIMPSVSPCPANRIR